MKVYKCPFCGTLDRFTFTCDVEAKHELGIVTLVNPFYSRRLPELDAKAQCTVCHYTSTVRSFRVYGEMEKVKQTFGVPQFDISQLDAFEKFDNVEVNGCHFHANTPEVVERSREGKDVPAYWSVYLHCETGGCDCLFDYATEAEARAVAVALKAAVPELRRRDSTA